MNAIRTGKHRVGLALLLGAVALCGGCSEELGPVPMPVTRVRGVVKEGDRPISGGWIEFIPIDGTVGNLRSARVRPDGKFDADRVAIGTNAIRLVDAPIESPSHIALFSRLRWASLARGEDSRIRTKTPARLFMPFASPIRRVIGTDTSAPLEIDVVEEAMRFENGLGRTMARTTAAAGEGP
jgi:hypothetical protein